ncbi:hypothetical protein BDD18_2120 [Acidovorax temperans]|uniref:Uncharacterized protein n=1 Tax=Acidovorax temperans TaxID=80878 RepID=A0A543L803_9BURK|nr:hypothetical protein BDD18_2120 [Acidovorax temperans]
MHKLVAAVLVVLTVLYPLGVYLATKRRPPGSAGEAVEV